MKKIMQKMTAGVLAVSMLLSMLPLSVFAKTSVLYGDVNQSGAVDKNDVNDLKKYLAEYDIDIDAVAADVNLDSAVDLQDLLLVEKYVAGQDIKLGDNVTITFDSDGGTPVGKVLLCNGATITDVTTEPVTQKDGYIFTGWVKKDGAHFYAEDPVTTDLDLKANYEVLDSNINETPESYALEDQAPDLTYSLVTAGDSTTADVLANILLLATDGSDPVELAATRVNNRLFTVSAVNGFIPGCSYELVLSDGLTFQGKAASIRKATFIIYKDEVDNLRYNSDILYIKDTDEMSYTINDTGNTVPVLDISLISEGKADTVSGTFDYTAGGLAIDDTLCIYKTVDPRNRDYIKNEYPDDPQSFIKITAIDGVTIHFSGLENDDASSVIFIPQTVPFSVETMPVSNNDTIDSTAYDTAGWDFMGQVDAPKFRIGDFIVFYTGELKNLSDDSPAYFGEITAINGSTLTFTKTTKDAIVESNDMYLNKPMSGDDLLENADVPAIERQIEEQAVQSGFAADATDYLLTMATKTDNFQNMTLKNVSYTDEQGKPLNAAQMQALAKMSSIPDIKVSAHINKKTTKIDQGVHLDLTIDANFSIELDDGAMNFQLHASFVEEISVKVTMKAKAGVKWYFIIPVLKSLTFGADTNLKNYSFIAFDLRIYTVGSSDYPMWDQFRDFKDQFSEKLNQIQALQNILADPFGQDTDVAKVNKQINDLWASLPSGSKQSYEDYCNRFDEINMTEKLHELLNSTSDEAMATGVQELMNRYSKMIKQETDWVTLTEQTIAEVDTKAYCPIVYVGIKISFVVKANVNISLGVGMDYLVGKQYSFWFDIIQKTSGNSTSDLTDERFAFSFYVMGYMGLKMGVKAEINVGVLWGLAEAGISAEFGPYIKLWGYFVYMDTKNRPANSSITTGNTLSMGALYFEFGLYVTIAANVSILKKSVYSPTLWDKEFPLIHAGVRNSVFAFATKIDSDEYVVIQDEDGNNSNGITMQIPANYRSMKYIDLVLGDQEQSVYDLSNFVATTSNQNFAFNSSTGKIAVTVPNADVHYMNCNLVLTWKQGKASFSSKDMRIVIPLVWTNLSTTELKQKFTVAVNVGNPANGYTPIWSERVVKGALYDLPTKEDILTLMNYDDYNFNGANLKYATVAGYGSQQTTELTTNTDQNYFFDVTPREYSLIVKNVESANGAVSTKNIKANFGDQFNISPVLSSGTNDDTNFKYTSYYNTLAKDSAGNAITSDISRPLDVGFAKELLNGTTYSATYVDNSITVTYVFTGDVDIPAKTFNVKRGTTPPDLFTADVLAQRAIVISVNPRLGNISNSTTYTVVASKRPAVIRTLTFVTNGGSAIASQQIPEFSVIAPPNDPTRAGYTFAGWHSDAALQTPFIFDTMPEGGDLTVYAKWDANAYDVTFDANGGALPNGTTNPISYKNGTAYGTLPVPTLAQYSFNGWFTARTSGTQIRQGDTVNLTANTTVYARWTAKTGISPETVICKAGQTKTYDNQFTPATFSPPSGISSDSFTVEYKRQGTIGGRWDSIIDTEWQPSAVNGGTYDIKISRAEDANYTYFEKTYIGVYTINKAVSSILTAPSAAEVYYGNIVPKQMVFGTDFIGADKLEYAAGIVEQYVVNPGQTPVIIGKRPKEPTSGWKSAGAAVSNIYDDPSIAGTDLYLWARIPEGENHLASGTKVSESVIKITDRPKALVSANIGGSSLTYKLWVQTSNITNAGTNSRIYAKIGNGAYQQLDSSADDFEKGDLRGYDLSVDPNLLYNNCGGTIPVMLRYERAGSSSGWHCAWVRLDVSVNGTLKFRGDQFSVNHWFGAEDYDSNVVEESCKLTGYERNIVFDSGFIIRDGNSATQPYNEENSVFDIDSSSTGNYGWEWSTPRITDHSRGVSYNPYEYINAPELSVTFDDPYYNQYFTQGLFKFSVDREKLYQAMAANKKSQVTLTYTLGFKPLSGVMSVTASTANRTRTWTFNAIDLQAKTLTNSPVLTARRINAQLASMATQVVPGKNGTFDVSYRLDQNVGIWGAKFAVDYDKTKVEMTGYTLGSIFAENEITAPESYTNGRYVFLGTRNDFTDTTATGKLVTLHFKIKDGVTLTEYPVNLDTAATQQINGESGVISTSVSVNAPTINASGNTAGILSHDTITVTASAGSTGVQSVRVKKDDAGFTDITATYSQGYAVSENGTYTFELTTTDGDTATTSITYTQLDAIKPVVAVHTGTYAEGTWSTGSVTLTPHNTANNKGATTLSYRVGENGTWTEYVSGVVVNADASDVDTAYYFKAVSEGGVESDIVEYRVKLDNKAPSGEITIGQNKWNTLLNNITFGLFFKETKEITIESTDTGSGVAKTEYYFSDAEVSDISSIGDWVEYKNPVTVGPNHKYVVYARITDQAGNNTVINTDGLVLENIFPSIGNITHGKVYCEAQTVIISDEYLDTVTVNNTLTALTDGKLTLAPTGKAQTIVATDKAGNSTTVTVTVYDGHVWDEGIITTAPTVDKKGVKTYTCTHCGETRTEEVEKLAPEITEGKNGQWKQGTKDGLSFRSNADLADFISVAVDGKIIGEEHYDLKEGSTVVTLKADYLNTLSPGKHTLSITSTTGIASTEFTITAKADDKVPSEPDNTESPQTGDKNNIFLWIALLSVSGSAVIILGTKGRTKKNSKIVQK